MAKKELTIELTPKDPENFESLIREEYAKLILTIPPLSEDEVSQKIGEYVWSQLDKKEARKI